MPDEQNGRITLAVLGYKIDNLQKSFDGIETIVKQDHDRIGKLESELADFTSVKRWLIGGAITLIGALITGIVILLQYIDLTHP